MLLSFARPPLPSAYVLTNFDGVVTFHPDGTCKNVGNVPVTSRKIKADIVFDLTDAKNSEQFIARDERNTTHKRVLDNGKTVYINPEKALKSAASNKEVLISSFVHKENIKILGEEAEGSVASVASELLW